MYSITNPEPNSETIRKTNLYIFFVCGLEIQK